MKVLFLIEKNKKLLIFMIPNVGNKYCAGQTTFMVTCHFILDS